MRPDVTAGGDGRTGGDSGGEELVRARQGVGLGLFMVAELARAHGGTARALTAVDGG